MWFDVPFKYCVTLSPVPPLTVDNIIKAVEGVKNWRLLFNWLGVYGEYSSLKDAVEQFLKGQGNYHPSWKAIIFVLDGLGDTAVANCVRSYGEPVQGVCVCVCLFVCKVRRGYSDSGVIATNCTSGAYFLNTRGGSQTFVIV